MFADADIRRQNLPRDVFQFIRACAYDREVPKDYRKDAQKILKADYDLANPPRTTIKHTRVGKSDKARVRAELTAMCDALVKKLLIAERGSSCERCGRSGINLPLHAAHIKSKGPYARLRFEKLNLLLLCYHDHIEWAHKEPDDFIQWIEQEWPGRLQTLREMAATAPRVDLKELVIALRLEVSAL